MASNVVSRRFSLEPTQRKTKPYHSCNSCSISATPFLHTGSSAQVLADGWARHIGKKCLAIKNLLNVIQVHQGSTTMMIERLIQSSLKLKKKKEFVQLQSRDHTL
jgi:hypothetical protein